MSDPSPRVIAILRKYMRNPNAAVLRAATLAELEIDPLDLPLIYLDLEDAFDIDVGRGDEPPPATADHLIARVAVRLAERANPRPRPQRRKSTWLSTGAERQR